LEGDAPRGTSGSSDRPLFPPMGVPSEPAISSAISAADSWQQLRELYSAVARTIDPAQLLALTQRWAALGSPLGGWLVNLSHQTA
jgi:hypothetical protein